MKTNFTLVCKVCYSVSPFQFAEISEESQGIELLWHMKQVRKWVTGDQVHLYTGLSTRLGDFCEKEVCSIKFSKSNNALQWTPRRLSVTAPAPGCQGCISVPGLWRRLGELRDSERHEHKSAEHSWHPAHHCGYSCSLPSVGSEHGVVGGAVKDETVFQFLKLGKIEFEIMDRFTWFAQCVQARVVTDW